MDLLPVKSIDKMQDCFRGAFRGKRILVTGHTGFKGSWLSEWLLLLGADVTGFALPPVTAPALFEQTGLARRMHDWVGDVRDIGLLRGVVAEIKPDFVFHLAAQPLVRLSYREPVETYGTNVMGTVHLLEAIRLSNHPCTVVAVTTDKCYENREWLHGYREEDPLGGHDPYSSSKAAAEIVIFAYRRSYFSGPDSRLRVASARAGNVIGGGDWAADRIVPDCIRALQRGETIPVRNKVATRPWQHVLEPLSGYLWLGARIAQQGAGESSSLVPNLDLNFRPKLAELCAAFNFGPSLYSNRTVAELVQEVLKHWPGRWEDHSDPNAPHEAGKLKLATDKAYHLLGWRPVWNFEETVERTVHWYREAAGNPADIQDLTAAQIVAYTAEAAKQGLPWATVDAERQQR